MNLLVAILSFLAAILEIKRSYAVVSVSIGILDPESMGIDISIALLGASLTKF